jgi:two-component system sensor histidine kinase DesK
MTGRGWSVLGRLLLSASALVIFAALPEVLGAEAGPRRAALIAGALVFAGLWIWFWWWAVDAPRVLVRTLAVVLLTLVLAGLTLLAPPGRDGLLLAALAAGAALEARRGVAAVVLIAALAGVVQLLHGAHPLTAAGGAVNDLVVGAGGIGGRLLLTTNQELTRARDQVAELAVAEERLRLARDLHDLLGQDLTLAVMKSELLARELPPELQARQTELTAALRQALDDVRAAVAGYRRLDLAGELTAARRALEAAGIRPELQAGALELPPAVAEALTWALRESVTNVIRHSGARRCRVELGIEHGVAGLRVDDDGRGRAAPSTGGGLRGIAERAAALGGTTRAENGPDGGFEVAVAIPVSEK